MRTFPAQTDAERFPDYQMFLEVARQTEVKLVLFATREFESADPERPKAVIRERQVWGQEVYPKLGDPVL